MNDNVPDLCIQCSKPNGLLRSNKAKFRVNKPHSSGLCPECQANVDKLTDMLMAGGTMVVCLVCTSITVVMEIPESLQDKLTNMPNGTKRLEVAGCINCNKEALNVTENDPPESQAPG